MPWAAAVDHERQDGIHDGDPRDALDDAHPDADGQVMVDEGREEVGEDAEDDGGAAELDAADEELGEAEAEA